MKSRIITLLALFCTLAVTAQKAINYKALIKDNLGNVVANQNITIEFSILEGPEIGFLDPVYIETHTVTTDANGIVIANIGEGNPDAGYEDAYEAINWGSFFGSHFLKVQIDTGSGLTDMGTTEFKAVPYALYAESSNNSGLEAINEGNGTGRRLIGMNPENYGPIANFAVDLSYSPASSTTRGATGDYAAALGYQTTASGYSSFASGVNTMATGTQATAMGAGTVASGHSSVAMGNNTIAEAPNTTAIGLFNVGGGDPLLASASDPLFEVGNGTISLRSNALTVLRNGIVTAPSFDIGEITDPKALITKEYADANYSGGGTGTSSTGLEVLDEGNGNGWRLVGSDPNNYGNIGNEAVDLSINNNASTVDGATGSRAVAMGFSTEASGPYALATGYNTEASGEASTAMGLETEASGDNSIAFGNGTSALGENALVSGELSFATGKNASAMGNGISANALSSTALGLFNVGGGDPTTWVGTDPVFEIGNGTDFGNKSNALTILKNGTIMAPSFDMAEITDPKALITKEYADANYSGGGSGTSPTGLEALDEGSGVGWRLIGRNPDNYGNIANGAIDFSYSNTVSDAYGAIGAISTALGYQTTASGGTSTAFGDQTVASGITSTAFGHQTEASGFASTAFGHQTEASGFASTAFGIQTTASGEYSFASGDSSSATGYAASAFNSVTEANGDFSSAFGYYTQAEALNAFVIGKGNVGGGNPNSWIETDPLFEIGNSNTASSSNALTVLKNGTITAPTFDMAEITDPKALITKEYADANYSGGGTGTAPTGLEALDEGNGTGWRLVGSNPDNFGDIGLNAVDLSVSLSADDTRGATGAHSFASGYLTKASGNFSTAIGVSSYASGSNSIALGDTASAIGYRSFASGYLSIAEGESSVAIGVNTQANGISSMALGRGTDAIGNYSLAAGYNTSANASNSVALGINTIASGVSSFAFGALSGASGSNAFAGGYESVASGDYSIALGYQTEASQNSAFAIGTNTIASGWYSTAMGYSTEASNLYALATGYNTEASGSASTSMGVSTIASGDNSTAMGVSTIASGDNSTAMGASAIASGNYSIAMGLGAIAEAFRSTAIGTNNLGGGSAIWDPLDPLLEVGNGVVSSSRSNALTILKNGYTTFGTHDVLPTTDFQINHDNDGTVNGLKLQNKGANENWWRFYTLNSNGQLYLYSKAGGNASPVGSFDDASGAYTALSDRRAKANFKDLYFNWQEFMQLQPLTYHYKTDENKKSHIGFVAQDVEPIYPELVNHNKEDDLYQLNYSGFGVVAIKAIQELKKENEQLKALLLKEEEANAEQTQVLQALLERVEALEKQQSNSSSIELVKN